MNIDLLDELSSVIKYRDIVALSQMGSHIDGVTPGDRNGHAVSVSDNGLIMAVSARYYDGNGSNLGHVRIYEWDNDDWLQIGSDIVGENNNEYIGDTISLNAEGNIIAIGISVFDGDGNDDMGCVRIYEYITNTWSKIGQLSGHNKDVSQELEVSLSSDGKIVAYGSYKDNSNTGRVDIYKYGNNSWQPIGNILGISADELFGAKVTLSADGNVLAASARMYSNNGNNIGQVRVYKYINNIWEQIGNIDGESNNDYSGTSVSLNIDGTILAIGAIKNHGINGSDTGHVRVYQYIKGKYVNAWIQMGIDIDGENEGDNFGNCVSLSNDGYLLAIGAPNSKGLGVALDVTYYHNVGHAQIFQYVSDGFIGKWVKMGYPIIGERNDDYFGESLALSKNGSVLVVGSQYSDCEEKLTYTMKGRVRVFHLHGSVDPITPLQSKVSSFLKIGNDIIGTSSIIYERIGTGLSISRDGLTMVCGAGDPVGRVIAYEWKNDNWVQKGQTLIGDTRDYFGFKVVISDNGNTFLASASLKGIRLFKYVNNIWTNTIVYNDNISSKHYCDIDMNGDGTIIVIGDSNKNGTSKSLSGYVIVKKWNGSSWNNMGSVITGDEVNARVGAKVSINAAGNILAVYGPNYGSTYPSNYGGGIVMIYEYNNITQQWDQLGGSFYGARSKSLGNHIELSLDGHTIAMGSYDYYMGAGKIIVYKWNTKYWMQHGNIMHGHESNGYLGLDFKFNADATMLVIRANGSYTFTDSNNISGGAIYVYQYLSGQYGGQWIRVFAQPAIKDVGNIAFAADTNKLIRHRGDFTPPGGVGGAGLNETYEIIKTQPEPVVDLSYSIIRIDKITHVYTSNVSNDRFGTCIAISNNGKIIAVSAPYDDIADPYTSNLGSVTMYELINGLWNKLGDPIFGSVGNEKIGETSISLSSNGLIVAVGAPSITFHGFNYYASGSVKVYYWFNNEWQQLGDEIKGPRNKTNAKTGSSISLSANGLIIAVGTPGLDTYGSVQIYKFKNYIWEPMGSAIGGEAAGEGCGSAVVLSGNGQIMAASSPYKKDESNSSTNTNIGIVRIYKYINNNWSKIGEILGKNETPEINYTSDYLGESSNSIALNYNGTIIATGSWRNGVNGFQSGCVRIFKYIDNNWETQMGTSIRGEIDERMGTFGDQSGRTVSLSNDGLTIVIGSRYHDDPLYGAKRGCMRVYKYIDNDWKLLSKIDADPFSHLNKLGERWPNKHCFGTSVALSGDATTLVSGAPYESDHFNNREGYVVAYKLVDLNLKNENFNIIKFGSDIDGEGDVDESGYSVSLSANGLVMAIGARYNDGGGTYSGHVRVYKYINNVWTKMTSIDIDGEAAGNQSGWSVSLSADGTIVAIGSPYNDVNGGTDSGNARVYEWNGSSWDQMGATIYGQAAGDWFGHCVSLNSNGNIIAIGAMNNDNDNGINAGSVNIYKFTDNTWTPMGTTIYGETEGEQCGRFVSLSSDGYTVAISAPDCNTNETESGCVYVYKWDGDSWNIMGSRIYGNYWSEKLGWCVSLSSDGLKLAIAGQFFNNKGYVYVYEWLNNEWTRIGNDLSADLSTATSRYGKYIELNDNGTILVIGSTGNGYNGVNSGSVEVYKWIDNNWLQIGENIYGDAIGDETGFSVSLNSKGNILSIGSRFVDSNGTDSGRVRTYEIIKS
tara:strand:- start:24 stop:5030 length:5007 start_codon:yes stop_codon:yes gene_type:complete